MTAIAKRSTIFGIIEETTTGTLKALSAGSDFIPMREGASMELALEELNSDELVSGDFGASKSYAGKETISGSHPLYLKHSGVAGTAPEYALLLESCLGSQTDYATEYDTVSSSTTALLKVDTGEGAQFAVGQAVLIKDSTNGYSIRNVASISSDDLTLNFKIGTAPASGVNLGKANLFKPTGAQGPSFSAWMYLGNSGAIQAAAGCRVDSLAIDFTSGQQATCDVSYSGTYAAWNPVVVTSSNNKIDFTDGSGTVVATLTIGIYKTPQDFASHVGTKMTAASVGSDNDTITCTYDSTTGKYTITSNGTVLSILWATGANNANSADTLLGFSADSTAALTYTSPTAASYATALTPSYDNADNIIVKSAELMIGDSTENFCRNAGKVSFSIDTPNADVESLCAESGVSEKIAASRSVSMSAELVLTKYEAGLFYKFVNNTTTQVMVNIGPKSSGNWIAGKCVNIYMGNASITAHSPDLSADFVKVQLSAKGFIDSNKKDVYINFI